LTTQAVGFIEAIGLAAAIEAADAAAKSANVSLLGYELSRGAGMVTVKLQGDVGAVKASIEAARIASSKVNQVYSTLVIPRPADPLALLIKTEETVFHSSGDVSISEPPTSEPSISEPLISELSISEPSSDEPAADRVGEAEEIHSAVSIDEIETSSPEAPDNDVAEEMDVGAEDARTYGNKNLESRKKKKGR
jgi:microcompartment protein CcmL/EutN